MIEQLIFQLERIVEEYIIMCDINSLEDIKLIKSVNDIVFNNSNYRYNIKYSQKYNYNKIDQLVTNFFKFIGFDYSDYYQKRKKDGTINFNKQLINYDTAFSSYDFSNNKRMIFIPLSNTLEDAFTMIHEVNHDKNIDESGENETRLIFTEGLSILMELLFEEYLKKNNVKDYKIGNNCNLDSINYKSLYIDFNLKLIECYLNKYNINYKDLYNIIYPYTKIQKDNLNHIIEDILKEDIIDIDFEFRYILGILIATYMYGRIKDNKKNIKELFEMNEIIVNYNIDQVFDYLNLDYDETNLSDNTYKILKKSYNNYLKLR